MVWEGLPTETQLCSNASLTKSNGEVKNLLLDLGLHSFPPCPHTNAAVLNTSSHHFKKKSDPQPSPWLCKNWLKTFALGRNS